MFRCATADCRLGSIVVGYLIPCSVRVFDGKEIFHIHSAGLLIRLCTNKYDNKNMTVLIDLQSFRRLKT